MHSDKMRTLYIIFGLLYSTSVIGQDLMPDTSINNISLESRISIINKFKADTLKIRERFNETKDSDLPLCGLFE